MLLSMKNNRNQFKKELEILFEPNLRMQPRKAQKALRTVPPIRNQDILCISFFEIEGCTLKAVLLIGYIIHI